MKQSPLKSGFLSIQTSDKVLVENKFPYHVIYEDDIKWEYLVSKKTWNELGDFLSENPLKNDLSQYCYPVLVATRELMFEEISANWNFSKVKQ